MIIRSFSAAQPCENLTFAAFPGGVPSRLPTPRRIEPPLSLAGVSFSSPNYASRCVEELGRSTGDDPPPWFPAWLVLVARINKFPQAGTQMAMAFAD
jgi:hypothetical protein